MGRLAKVKAASELAARALFARDAESSEMLRHMLASKVAFLFGDYQLYKATHSWPHDPEFLEIWRAYPEGDEKVRDRRFALFQLARAAQTLEGDTVECGAWRGAGSYLICKATAKRGRVHHVFDSFEGLPAPAAVDKTTSPSGHVWKAGEFATPVEVVEKNLREFDVRIYKGWIPERFNEVADRRFAFVHLNVNLAEPTRASLEFFYERLVPGGLLVTHDYGFVDTPGSRQAFDEFIASKPERHVVHLTSGQGFIVKR